MSSFLYFLREAFKGFGRHMSTTIGSIITIFLSLFILGMFGIGGVIIQNIVSGVENEVSITCYVADKADNDKVTEVQTWISGLEGVESVSFVTKEQALADFTESMASSPEIVAQLDGQNPLPASIVVNLDNPQKVQAIADKIAEDSTFIAICDNPDDPGESLKYGQKTVERLFALTNTIRYVGLALIILLVVIAGIFINNTIRLAILARRREIAIMRLVGASNGFIRGPFLMEGALHAIIGALLAILFLELIHYLALPKLSSALMWLPINVNGFTFFVIYVSLLVAGLIIGLVASAIAMRRYLKV